MHIYTSENTCIVLYCVKSLSWFGSNVKFNNYYDTSSSQQNKEERSYE